jgi:hypothetical protein
VAQYGVAAIIQALFEDHFQAYRRLHKLTWRENWAGFNIMTCRTATQGVHLLRCPNGHVEALRYNSCKHRCCPQCGWVETERWIQKKQEQALPCGYHQIVFTIDHDLIPLWLYNRHLFVNLMFDAAWHALRQLLKDERWLGALPGAIGAFQSWGETLNVHPHLHFIVTAGGLDKPGRWRACEKDFLLPSRVLRALFQGKLLAYLREHLEDQPILELPPDWTLARTRSLFNRLGRARWNVHIEPRYNHPNGILKYIGRYMRQGPISESRIVSYSGSTVRIAYKRPEEHHGRFLELPAEEMLRRILVHVPPKGLRMVRAFGLFHHRMRADCERAREQLKRRAPADAHRERGESRRETAAAFPTLCCPHCGARMLVFFAHHPARASPLVAAA